MKTLKEAAKILVAGTHSLESASQSSAFCVCGRPLQRVDNLEEGGALLGGDMYLVRGLEAELARLEEQRIELAREIGKVMARESELRHELKRVKREKPKD